MKTIENVLLSALDERWKKYRAELKICKNEFSEEAVHDLRVATRRLLAVMDILRSLDPHPRIQKIRRALKNQLDSLDDMRDTQVMLVEVSESEAHSTELKPFEESLLKREKRLLRAARKEIKSLSTSEMNRRIEKSRASLEEKVEAKEFETRLLSVADQAYGRAIGAFVQIEASQPASIHRFRIAFKKFRYMVEIVSPVLKNYPEAHFKQMHDYQSRMGDLQDAEVFLSALMEFAERTETSSMPDSVRESFANQRAEIIAKFMDGKEEIHLFWRTTPDQNFPWEKKNEPLHRSSRHSRGGRDAGIRRRQPASIDRQGKKENAKDRAGAKGTGNGDQSDSDQSIPAGGGNGEDSA